MNQDPTTGAADQIPVKWDPGDCRPPAGDTPPARRRGVPMRTPPEILAALMGAEMSDQEGARRACNSAWRRWDGEGPAPLDASGKSIEKGAPCELLPAPAGEDEARIRYPQHFGLPALAPALAPAGASTKPISPARTAPPLPDVPAVLAGIVPREFARLCDSERQIADLTAEHAAGRLASVFEESAWLAWRAGAGWRPITTAALLAAVTLAGRANHGMVDRDGVPRMRPQAGGRAATAAGVLRILAGLPGIETRAADWDGDPVLVGLPSGEILNLATGNRRPAKREDRIRRRLGAMPATDAEYSRSRFAAVLDHCVPDPDARAFLARRLGAALQNAGGLDHLICMYGPGGSGKGSVLEALRAVFGDYEAGIPTAEIMTGGRRSHSAWKARLTGCRLLTVDDLPVGRDLDTAVIKELVGGRLNGIQHMGAEFFDLDLSAPILTAGNAPPSVPGLDSGTERRLVPIQCGPPVEKRDPEMRDSMRTDPAERGACLRWLINGGVEYRFAGCPVPDAAREAAAEVGRAAPIGEFTAQWVARHGADPRPIADVYTAWQAFMVADGKRPGAKNVLSGELTAAGWERSRWGTVRLIAPPLASIAPPLASDAGDASDAPANPPHTPARDGGSTKLRHLASPASPCASTGTPPADMPSGALDGYANGEKQVPAPADGPAVIPEKPPPMPESDQQQIDALEGWMRKNQKSWHVPNPDPDSPVPGRFALVARDPNAPDWARRIAVKRGRRALAEEWRSEMLAAGLNPDDRPNPWAEES